MALAIVTWLWGRMSWRRVISILVLVHGPVLRRRISFHWLMSRCCCFSLEWITLVSCSRRGPSARIHLKQNQLSFFWQLSTHTTFQVVTRDDFDVDVLGDRGEGYLEAADGGGVPWLDLGKPASTARWVLIQRQMLFGINSNDLSSPGLPHRQKAGWSDRDGVERPSLFSLRPRSHESSFPSKSPQAPRSFR